MSWNIRQRKVVVVFFALFSLSFSASAQTLRYFKIGFRGMADSGYLVAATSDPAVIARCIEQAALPVSDKTKHINGKVARGTGNNNPKYDWHFVNNAWDLVEISIEVCDINPTSIHVVDDDTSHVCPWSTYVISEVVPSGVRNGVSLKGRHNSLWVFPSERIMVHNTEHRGKSILSIVDLQGKTMQRAFVDGSAIVEMGAWGPGAYLLRNANDRGGTDVKKLIKSTP